MNTQKYIIVKDGKVVREASASACPYYEHAILNLKPDKLIGEKLYLEVIIRTK